MLKNQQTLKKRDNDNALLLSSNENMVIVEKPVFASAMTAQMSNVDSSKNADESKVELDLINKSKKVN